ncbi:MAG: spondin domain-containing protein [Bacteroidota bacterium]
MRNIFYTLSCILILCLSIGLDAQPTFFKVRVENVGQAFPFAQSGVFNTPVDSTGPGPLFPGAAYEFSFDAAPGHYLSFATMFVQSNDLFYAPDEIGIALYDSMGNPITGDLTNQLDLWDPGTELNEAPGEGANQAPRQTGPDMGDADTDSTVRLVDDEFSYPEDSAVIRFTLTHNGGTSFTARIENVSTMMTLPISNGDSVAVPLAPGVFVVHTDPAPLFTIGEVDRGEGLEGIAEDGDASLSAITAASKTGVTAILAPGVYALHGADDPLFTVGMVDRGEGLEAIAEDGSPAMLAGVLRDNSTLTAGAFAVPVGAAGPGPLLPGGAYEFIVASGPTGKLSFATMFVQSNDLFYGPDGMGIALFDSSGTPLSGDITDQIDLWDGGTELNEIPGIGLNQAPRQSGPDTGDADTDSTVRLVDDGFTYPEDSNVIRVTLTPLESEEFTVRIQNVSTTETLVIDDSTTAPVPLAPGSWVLHSEPNPLFTEGEPDRGLGIEEIAEDGNASIFADAFSMKMGTPNGIFTTPVDSAGPGPLFPGAVYEFSFTAAPGVYLSLATMFVQSNDLFYAPDGNGIALFDTSGVSIAGDVTDQFLLWDSGTEENEQPGVGENQAPRQSGPNIGPADSDSTVRLVSDAFTYPPASSVIRITINEEITTSVEDLLDPQNSSVLGFQNYPNPFSNETVFRVDLKEREELNLTIFDLQGRKIAEILPTSVLPAGTHEFTWEGSNTNGQKVSAGVYFARLNGFDQGVSTLRLLLQN